MCGIAGYISRRPVGDDVLDRMVAALVHRGPDADGYFRDGSYAAGMRRLAIVDLAHGDQPLYGEGGEVVLIYNGEIYNYPELRAELSGMGYRFFSHGDTEVIIKAYHAWGPDCVKRFKGMFAFAIHERDSGRVMLARDRFGIKPLYTAEVAGGIAFASEPQALIGAGLVTPKLRPEARAELHTADDLFTTMGAAGFARRARRELVAAGARLAPTPPTASPALLTPQETQISELAALGATNREIASQLFLSEGTIEYHLTKVFRKLSVTSRRQLRRRLAPEPIDH